MRGFKKAIPYVLLLGCLLGLAFHATLSLLAVKYLPSLQDIALAHLARLGEQAVPYVLELLGASDPRVKEAGLSLLKAVGEVTDWSQDYPQLLQTVLNDFRTTADPLLKKKLAGVLGTSSSREAVDALSSGAKDPAVHDACVSALGTIADRAPSPALKDAARQATALAGSVEARGAVSATVDAVGSVARPVADTMQMLLGGVGGSKPGAKAPVTTAPR